MDVDEDDESYYIGVGTLDEVVSRAEYRASEHHEHERCYQYIKVTNSKYNSLMDVQLLQYEALLVALVARFPSHAAFPLKKMGHELISKQLYT
jgi:hypothetical protein